MINLKCGAILLFGLFILRSAIAGDDTNLFEQLRIAVPPGWEVVRQTGTISVNVTRKRFIPAVDITTTPVPSSPAFGEGNEHYAMSNGIRVWFYIEPVGNCSDAEYSQLKSQNAKIWSQLEQLRTKIEQIPYKPQVKPSFSSRAPRNEEEQSWLAEYNLLRKQLKVIPTHHSGTDAFCINLLKSYSGATIHTPVILEEIGSVKKRIETVLEPYEREDLPARNSQP